MVLNACWFYLFWLIFISFPDFWCWWCCVHKNLCKRIKASMSLSAGMKWRAVKPPVQGVSVCAVPASVLYVTVCARSEPRPSIKCILLSVFISDTIPLHFYATDFHVCFVFCSCHLLWFPRLLNVLGITHSCLGVFLIENPAVLWLGLKHFLPSAEVSVEFPCCWQVLCCQGIPPRATQRRESKRRKARPFKELQAALLNPELCYFPSFCPLSFFLLSLSCPFFLPVQE